jgi:conjugal transfer pilus assembly protein TraV
MRASTNDRSRAAQRVALVGFIAATLAGCAALDPYESTFACEKSKDYGRCQNVHSAYDEAVVGEAQAPGAIKPGKKEPTWRYRERPPSGAGTGTLRPLPEERPKPSRKGAIAVATRAEMDPAYAYRAAEYRELATLIEKPVTPVVRPPHVLRTLIVPYASGGALYMPRFVYYFADEARFVLGEYLNPPEDTKTVVPTRAALSEEAEPPMANAAPRPSAKSAGTRAGGARK